jgi:2,3-bisphosphoglycerate-independent phosphoglycerate mutase
MEKVILLILDGWGYREERAHNAILLSNPVNYNRLLQTDPNILLDAGGEEVGLPAGQMGNSEVGHTNIGAGRIVYQDLVKVTKAFDSGKAQETAVFKDFIKSVTASTGRLHLIGLLSDGGVHSHINHFKSAINAANKLGVGEVFVHVITDGRDTPPNSGLGYVSELWEWLKANKVGRIADVSGRYYAMDRDKRWDRVEVAFNTIRNGKGSIAADPVAAINASYAASVTDEFINPVRIAGVDGTINDGDGLFFMNFRADRMREILSAFYLDEFSGFERGGKPNLKILTLTEYDETLKVPALFPPEELHNILGEVVSGKGLKQLRIAETEKYAHVTYFFNGGREEPFPYEERIMIPSPRDVATYDLRPEMSIREVADNFLKRYSEGDLTLAVMNFANPDMVGHTGVESAAITACKAVDEMIGKVIAAADEKGAALFITADHGNSEQMWDDIHDQPHTAHTTNPVRLIMHNTSFKFIKERGKLADIAPTILTVLGIDIPADMTGDVLIGG